MLYQQERYAILTEYETCFRMKKNAPLSYLVSSDVYMGETKIVKTPNRIKFNEIFNQQIAQLRV